MLFFIFFSLLPYQSFAEKTEAIPDFVLNFIGKDTPLVIGKQYFTGFESLNEFKNFYLVPPNYMGTSNHELVYKDSTGGTLYNLRGRSNEEIAFGRASHKAYIRAKKLVKKGENTNHRAYPTFQLLETDLGIIKTSVLVEFWVWADFQLLSKEGKSWISLATFTSYTDNKWPHSYLINVDAIGRIHLMHVPHNGKSVHISIRRTL